MNYILTSLNRTSSRATAAKDFIKLGFSVNPRDIRYDDLPSLSTQVTAVNQEERDTLIRERLMTLIERIGAGLNTTIALRSYNNYHDRVEVAIQVQEDLLKFRL